MFTFYHQMAFEKLELYIDKYGFWEEGAAHHLK